MGRDLGETPDYERYQDRAENDGANHRFNIPARSDRHEDHVSELHVEKIQRIRSKTHGDPRHRRKISRAGAHRPRSLTERTNLGVGFRDPRCAYPSTLDGQFHPHCRRETQPSAPARLDAPSDAATRAYESVVQNRGDWQPAPQNLRLRGRRRPPASEAPVARADRVRTDGPPPAFRRIFTVKPLPADIDDFRQANGSPKSCL
jgi:hypothetical protein